MNDKKRDKNETKFENWKETEDGGRVYRFEISGHHGWKARKPTLFVKEVDKNENTIRFYQEIYNKQNELIEVHEKYPIDKGHKKNK